MVGSYKYRNAASGVVKGGKCVGQLIYHYASKKDFVFVVS
jgi:hypothetical protein